METQEEKKQPKKEEPISFDPKQIFSKQDNFTCNSLGFPKPDERAVWTHKAERLFERELEDLMRKYKVVQVVATIFSKL